MRKKWSTHESKGHRPQLPPDEVNDDGIPGDTPDFMQSLKFKSDHLTGLIPNLFTMTVAWSWELTGLAYTNGTDYSGTNPKICRVHPI